jgi:uncharacterized membrane protein
MKPVLVIALTAILSAGISSAVVLVSQPEDSSAARAAAAQQVQDRAVLRAVKSTNNILGNDTYKKDDIRKALDAINKNLNGICIANVGQADAGQYCAN